MNFDLKKLSPVAQMAVIIGSLALISFLLGMIFVPRYIAYITKMEQQESVENLKSICIAELEYFQKNKRYTESFDELGYTPTGMYTYYLGQGVRESSDGRVYLLPKNVPTFANDTGFKAVAVANLDEDADLDVWTVDERGVISNLFNDFNRPSLKDYPKELRWIFKKKPGGH
jgi:hypothetical protein